MNVGRKHFGNDLIETKINHCGYLISLGDQGNKSSIDTLINDPIVFGIPRNPSQILLGDAPIVLIESLGKTVTTWSFFLVHLKNCSLNFLF